MRLFTFVAAVFLMLPAPAKAENVVQSTSPQRVIVSPPEQEHAPFQSQILELLTIAHNDTFMGYGKSTIDMTARRKFFSDHAYDQYMAYVRKWKAALQAKITPEMLEINPHYTPRVEADIFFFEDTRWAYAPDGNGLTKVQFKDKYCFASSDHDSDCGKDKFILNLTVNGSTTSKDFVIEDWSITDLVEQ